MTTINKIYTLHFTLRYKLVCCCFIEFELAIGKREGKALLVDGETIKNRLDQIRDEIRR